MQLPNLVVLVSRYSDGDDYLIKGLSSKFAGLDDSRILREPNLQRIFQKSPESLTIISL